MNRQTGYSIVIITIVLLIGISACWHLFQWDNKYTSALPGGYGYNVLQDDPDDTAFLVDGWEYYPGELLDPEDFAGGISPEFYTYIGEYPNFSAHLGSPYGAVTYRLILKNEGQPVELALYLQELLCAGRVYIDGRLAGSQGEISPYSPSVTDSVYSFTADGDTEIIVQCVNYTHYYSGMYYPPAIGTPEAIFRMIALRMIVYGFLCFVSLTVALVNLSQWLRGHDRAVRRMGLLCLFYSIWISYPFFRLLNISAIRPLYALEDFCSSGVLLCAVLLAGELSDMEKRWYQRKIAVALSTGLCAVTVLFPLLILPHAPVIINLYGTFLFFWKLMIGIYLLFLAGFALHFSVLARRCLLCASGLYGLCLIFSVVTVNHFEPISGAWPQEYGGFVLVLGFAVLMVQRAVMIARENRRLTHHLQDEVEKKTRGMETLLKERRELLANLLHDVKNPLSALQSYAELVRSGGVELDGETADYLDALAERAETVGQRFDQLQNFSRGEREISSASMICLNDFLQDFYKRNRPDMEISGLGFYLRLPGERLKVRGNEERLTVALENLCYNALSFTNEDGMVELALRTDGQNAVISVRDTGVGISEEDLPHIFDRGFSSRPDGGGEGLGLFLVKRIALEHNGLAEVQSRKGKGSTFLLKLPLCED